MRTLTSLALASLLLPACRGEDSPVDLSVIEAELVALQEQVSANAEQSTTNAAGIVTNAEELQAVGGVDVTDLLEEIDSFSTDLSDMEADVQANEDDIGDLEDRANALETADFATETWVEERDYASASNLDLVTTTVSSNTTTL